MDGVPLQDALTVPGCFQNFYPVRAHSQPFTFPGVLTGMCASQVWGTEYMREGKELLSGLQVRHMNFLKGALGMKRASTNWSALRECGHALLQFYWFKSAVKMHNGFKPHRLRGMWRDVEGFDPRETNDKSATYQALFALPFDHNMRKPIRSPRHLHLDLPQRLLDLLLAGEDQPQVDQQTSLPEDLLM
eukprot:1160762-Pelagomonas_calceolata.AAC.2